MSQLQLLRSTSLGWLPDETVFSLASRFHRLSGHGAPAGTCQFLFGHRQQGAAHDLPARLDHLASVSDGLLGTGETIARDHTILGYFLPFRPADMQRQAIAALCGEGIGSLKFGLGLLTSRFGAHHPLKACPDCMRQDLERYHTAYWHRVHQLPGVWVCGDHHRLLQECIVKSNYVRRFSFVLPDPALLRHVVESATPETARALRSTAAMSADVLTLRPPFELVSHGLAQTLRNRIFSFEARIPKAQHREIVALYNEHCSALRKIPEFTALPDSYATAEMNLASLVRSPRAASHPIRWIAAFSCFFPELRAVLDAYAAWNHAPERVGSTMLTSQARASSREPLRSAFLRALTNSSVRLAAIQAGVDVSTGLAWAAAAGVNVERRPKILKGAARERIVKMLEAGVDKVVASEQGGVALSTITRLLHTEVGLHQKWAGARAAAARKKARQDWTTATQVAGAQGIKFCRSLAPAAYAWLRRNDTSWLEESSRSIRLDRRGENNVHVAWDERDRHLAASVEQAAAHLQAQGATSIKLWQIHQAVPELRPKLTKLARLPMTAALLKRFVQPGHVTNRSAPLWRPNDDI